ncbi:MAG: CbbQ/NirQ/NorQ/GpvN family protein [Gammaproteobacteria bacterium]|nr:MAG: CbbQ/NirQ/NorQ/GpvN family protein [Gammaproteobacteria bacterium]
MNATISNINTPAQPSAIKVAGLFNNLSLPDSVNVLGYDSPSGTIQPVNRNYHFRREIVREVFEFLNEPDGDALMLTGPIGSGKTSVIGQVLSRLNWGCDSITASGNFTFDTLVGHNTLMAPSPGAQPVMKFKYGVLPKAMKHGRILLINEFDYANPSEMGGLNDILEGAPLIIPENGGEVIHAHPMFRVVVTGNSQGSGDKSGLMPGIKTQNPAFLDRFRITEVPYMNPEEELKLCSSVYQMIPEDILRGYVEVANGIRVQFLGDETSAPTLSTTMSTRVLLRWIHLTIAFRNPELSSMQLALDHALLRRVDHEDRAGIRKMCSDTFGDQWTKAI